MTKQSFAKEDHVDLKRREEEKKSIAENAIVQVGIIVTERKGARRRKQNYAK